MTHSGGKPHQVGYHGQQYEVSFFDPDSNARRILGWTNDEDDARRMANAVDIHPTWKTPWVTDLFASKQHGGHSTDSAVTHPLGAEQARFEAWWPTVHQTIGKVAAWAAWQACVAAHQPQGAPVAHVINTGSEWSALIQENLPDGTKLFTADQWSQSPCQHLSTSKEGASYCTLAEAQSLRLVEAEAEITRLRARQEFVFHMKTVKFFQGMIEELKAERDAAIAAHREKS